MAIGGSDPMTRKVLKSIGSLVLAFGFGVGSVAAVNNTTELQSLGWSTHLWHIVHDVRPGMTKAQVDTIAGPIDRRGDRDGTETWCWYSCAHLDGLGYRLGLVRCTGLDGVAVIFDANSQVARVLPIMHCRGAG
jgi:hypothetical protein